MIVHVLQAGADIRLRIDVVAAKIDRASLGKGQVQFELTEPDAKRVGWQLEKTPHINEFQIAVSESAVGIGSRDAEVVIHPEGDIAAEISRHEDTEEARFKVRARNTRRGQGSVIVSVGAGYLEELVIAQANGRQARNGPGKDGVGPQILLCRRAQ